MARHDVAVYAGPVGSRLMCVLVVAALVGCAARGSRATAPSPRPISYGYALLYEMVRVERFTDKLLLVKAESDAVKRIVDRIARQAGDLRGQLEKIAEGYPAISIDSAILPDVQLKMLRSLETEQMKDVMSRSGKDFERTLLVVLVGFLQQERHLARVMVDAETDATRRRFWSEAQRGFDAESADAQALLERRYFR